ncbi:MAG: YihY/virulence factor BrkB family protein, partial [Actinomycetota bacterium]|nr:YihY/virulence factor BrkB family protein [Actinomycetota bacterium]
MRDKLEKLGERWRWFGTALRLQKRYSELNGNYLAGSVTLAGFLSLFPLLLFAIAVLGFFAAASTDLAGNVVERLGLTGDAEDAVVAAVDKARESRKAASLVGIAGLLWSGLGLVAAVQYAVNASWQVASRGWRDKLKGLVWLSGATAVLLGSLALSAAINFLPTAFAPLSILVGVAVNLGLWLWTLKVLANRDVGWRSLLPGAVMGAIGLEILKLVGSVYVPYAAKSASALYGTLGVVFATLAWLLILGRLVVYSAVLNVVRWEEDHGTLTVELEVPKVPGEVAVEATRAGETRPEA